jgi:nitrogen fixation protein FixH
MKPATRWPVGILLVLATTVTANAVLYYVAGADPSFAIEPNYYAKAVAWDSTAAQGKRNTALGWRLSPSLTPFVPRVGARLSVALADAAGAPITDAIVKVSALYNARANTVLESTLRPDTSGYATILGVSHAGQWEFRFDVTRRGQHFTSTVRLDAVRAAPGP